MMNKRKRFKQKDMVSYMALAGLKSETVIPNMNRQHPAYIEQVVCTYLEVHPKTLGGVKRTRDIVFARQVIMFLIRRYSTLSLMNIGKRYNKDHTTVIHSLRTINNLMDTDPVVRSKVRHLESEIQ